jgi:hypothetical protein
MKKSHRYKPNINHHSFFEMKILINLHKNGRFEKNPPLSKIYGIVDPQIPLLKIYSQDYLKFQIRSPISIFDY